MCVRFFRSLRLFVSLCVCVSLLSSSVRVLCLLLLVLLFLLFLLFLPLFLPLFLLFEDDLCACLFVASKLSYFCDNLLFYSSLSALPHTFFFPSSEALVTNWII